MGETGGKLLRVVIADDEDLIRDGLKSLVNWEQLGFTVVAVAEDGEEALEMVESTVPYLLITDIRMPFLSGLDLIAATQERFPQTKAVLLTGHDEFEYAREAIELHAQAYLLKPLEPDTLIRLLSRLREEWEREQAARQELKKLRRVASRKEPAYNRHALRSLVRDRMEVTDRERLFDSLGVGGGQIYASLLLWSTEEEGETVLDQWSSACPGSSVTWEFYEGLVGESEGRLSLRALTLLWSEEVHDLHLREQQAMETARQHGFGLAVSRARPLRGGLGGALEECGQARTYALHTGVGAVIRFDEIPEIGRWESGRFPGSRELAEAARLGDVNRFDQLLSKARFSLSEVGSKDLPVLEALTVHLLVGTFEELSSLIDPSWDLVERVSEVQRAAHLREKVEIAIAALQELFALVGETLHRGNDRRIEEAAEYIRTHYSQRGLSLEDVAKAANLSPGYLSSTFKRKYHLHFVEYLTTVRMEAAKRLLRGSAVPAYVVAEEAGYDNPSYFSTAFKKHEGITPTEYRKKHRS